MVWYCDNKTCQYTKHGVYRKYRIENWKSSKFGKKFVLCDGCVRQYEQQPVYIQPVEVQVGVNLPPQNGSYVANNGQQPGAANSALFRSATEILGNQPEGVSNGNVT